MMFFNFIYIFSSNRDAFVLLGISNNKSKFAVTRILEKLQIELLKFIKKDMNPIFKITIPYFITFLVKMNGFFKNGVAFVLFGNLPNKISSS